MYHKFLALLSNRFLFQIIQSYYLHIPIPLS
nr:MAG TPA: hypothetical protein [Caudoviricetes sp.]